MKKICYSILLTAVVAGIGLELADRQRDSSLGKKDKGGLFVDDEKTSADPTAPESIQAVDRTGKWRTVIADAHPTFAKPDAARVADPIGAFQRWADQFMDGTANVEEGLRLAEARRAGMARLIRDNPRQAIANRVDDDTREALPEAIRDQLEQPIHGTCCEVIFSAFFVKFTYFGRLRRH